MRNITKEAQLKICLDRIEKRAFNGEYTTILSIPLSKETVSALEELGYEVSAYGAASVKISWRED